MAAPLTDLPLTRQPEAFQDFPGDSQVEPSDVLSAAVLVVDDDSRNLLALESVLEGQDYALVQARTGDEALRAVMSENFAVIVLDVQMPDISGIELARLIKQRKSTQHIPIIFLTAHYREEEHAVLGYDVGAVDYLTKPVNPAVLRSKVNVFIDLFRKTRALTLLNQTMEREISERRKAEERFRVVIEAAPNAMVVFGETGAIRLVNPQAETLFRGSREELLQCRVTDLIAGNAGVGPGSVVRTLQRRDGGSFPAEIHCRPIQSSEGSLFLASVVDLTERLKAEEAHRARAEADAANEAKDRFLAILSHELRTPLSPIVYAAALLQADRECPAHLHEAIETIQRNVRLEARLIDDLLDLARIRNGKLTLQKQKVEAHEILREALKISLRAAGQKKIRVVEELAAERTYLQGDPVRLRQILWNLLTNAAKFTPADGSISIYTKNSEQGDFLLIEISDTGIGIEAEKLETIFGAFEQVSSNHPGGLGLGLSICKALVDLHGGTIEARSEGANCGSSFVLTFPCLAGHFPGEEETIPSLPETATARVLIVEDHLDTAETLRCLLELKGHKVEIAGSIAEALDIGRQYQFDILISDIGLPDGKGLHLLNQLRNNGQPTISAIAVSGYGTQEDLERSRLAGFSEHLTKPVELSNLLQAVSRLSANIPASS